MAQLAQFRHRFPLLVAVLVAQVWLTGLSFARSQTDEALVQLCWTHPLCNWPTDMILQLTVDGEVVLDERVDAGTADLGVFTTSIGSRHTSHPPGTAIRTAV